MRVKKLKELDLENRSTMGQVYTAIALDSSCDVLLCVCVCVCVCVLVYCTRYTFKALGAGFYGLRTESGFKPTIKQVIMEAGDADRLIHIHSLTHSLSLMLCMGVAMQQCAVP